MGSCSLQHIRNPRSTRRGPSRPATFRLQGLGTLLTACSLESRAGFVSHRRRSWDSPFGGFLSRRDPRPFSREKPAYRWLSGNSAARSVRPARRASVSRFTPARIALRPNGVLGRQPPAPPLGFAPLGFSLRRSCHGLLRNSSHVLGLPLQSPDGVARTSEYRSTFAAPRPTGTEMPNRPRQPLWGSCTCPIPTIQASLVPGLYTSPFAGSCIAADSPTIFGH